MNDKALTINNDDAKKLEIIKKDYNDIKASFTPLLDLMNKENTKLSEELNNTEKEINKLENLMKTYKNLDEKGENLKNEIKHKKDELKKIKEELVKYNEIYKNDKENIEKMREIIKKTSIKRINTILVGDTLLSIISMLMSDVDAYKIDKEKDKFIDSEIAKELNLYKKDAGLYENEINKSMIGYKSILKKKVKNYFSNLNEKIKNDKTLKNYDEEIKILSKEVEELKKNYISDEDKKSILCNDILNLKITNINMKIKEYNDKLNSIYDKYDEQLKKLNNYSSKYKKLIISLYKRTGFNANIQLFIDFYKDEKKQALLKKTNGILLHGYSEKDDAHIKILYENYLKYENSLLIKQDNNIKLKKLFEENNIISAYILSADSKPEMSEDKEAYKKHLYKNIKKINTNLSCIENEIKNNIYELEASKTKLSKDIKLLKKEFKKTINKLNNIDEKEIKTIEENYKIKRDVFNRLNDEINKIKVFNEKYKEEFESIKSKYNNIVSSARNQTPIIKNKKDAKNLDKIIEYTTNIQNEITNIKINNELDIDTYYNKIDNILKKLEDVKVILDNAKVQEEIKNIIIAIKQEGKNIKDYYINENKIGKVELNVNQIQSQSLPPKQPINNFKR
ncbi:MAG: hypothetical protein ACP5RI_02470 [Candidatus Micrarchaeia archaeon]